MIDIIVTVITGLVAIVTCTINSKHQSEVTRELTEYKIDELTKRVDKHNHVIQRTYALEQHEAVINEQIKVINHRLQDLEDVGK
jgi:hypothetical protein